MADRPQPPSACPTAVTELLTDADPEELRAIAEYAEQLAAFEGSANMDTGGVDGADTEERRENGDEREAGPDDDVDAETEETGEPKQEHEDLPDDVPPKATVVVKEINDNRYYYWQWREGDTVTSKYKGPVDPDQ